MTELNLLKKEESQKIPDTIHVIIGSTGDGDDYAHWIVASFIDPDEADKFLVLLNEEGDRIVNELNKLGKQSWEYAQAIMDDELDENKYDDKFQVEDSEFFYRREEIKLYSELPNAKS